MKTLRNLFAAALATAAIIFTVGCPGPSTPDTPEEPVAAVTFSPNGGAVNSGSQVRLDTATSDAEIYYAIDPANAITAENVKDMLSSMTLTANVTVSVPITKACTIYAVAVRSSTGTTSEVTSATYTLTQAPGTVTFNPVAGTVASGTKVKLSATPAEGEESCTIYYSTSTALTAENYKTSGTVYDQAGDGIEITANTTIYAIAVGAAHAGNPSSAAYTLPVTLMNAAPEADDVVYIYYPTGKNVMLSTASGSELSKADVTPDESGSFTTTDAMAALTVFKNEIGQYVFVSGGKYLTTTTRNNLTLSDTFTVFALWDVAAISEGSNTFYIHSANSIYSNTRQGLEYYNNRFSAYDRRTQEIYQFQFYKDPSKDSELNAEAKASLALQANSLATPKFSVSSTQEGQTIVPGIVTYLTSDSLDVDFYYTTDGSDITGDNYGTKISTESPTAYKYVASQGIVINGNQNDTVTINAIAVKTVSDGGATRGIFSLPASAVYRLGEDTNTYLQKVTTLSDNDVVAIYYPQGKTTISSSFSGDTATETQKGIVFTDSITLFTVKKFDDRTYVFINGEKYLASTTGTRNTSLVLSDGFDGYALWNLEEVSAGSNDGLFYIKNKNAVDYSNRQVYVEFYQTKFATYYMQTNQQDIYKYQFYKHISGVAEQVELGLLPPKFAIASGSTVSSGTEIAITNENSAGTEIYWKWKSDGEADLTSANYNSANKYDAATNEPKAQEGTLQAIAVDTSSNKFSSIASATYIISSGSIDNYEKTQIESLTQKRNTKVKGYTQSIDNTNSSITVAIASGNNSPCDYNSTGVLRIYSNNTLTVTAKDSKLIKSVVFTASNANCPKFTSSVEPTALTEDASAKTSSWISEAGANSVVFTVTSNSQIKSIVVSAE